MVTEKQAIKAKEMLSKLPSGVLDEDYDVGYSFSLGDDDSESLVNLDNGNDRVCLTESELKELMRICKRFYGWK